MIGERLRKLRKERKLNQEGLANIIGVQKSAISMYETNKNDPSGKVKKETFLLLPSHIKHEEKILLSEFVNFIHCRRKIDDKWLKIKEFWTLSCKFIVYNV